MRTRLLTCSLVYYAANSRGYYVPHIFVSGVICITKVTETTNSKITQADNVISAAANSVICYIFLRFLHTFAAQSSCDISTRLITLLL